MKPALSQVCTLESAFQQDIEDYAAGHCPAIEVWLTKLETYLESHDESQLRSLLQQHQVELCAASFQGGLLASQGDQRREAWNLFEQRLQLCRRLSIPTLICACDVPLPLSQTTVERVQSSLQQIGAQAGHCGLRVAVEFQASSALGNNLQTAAALVADAGSPHLGICLDMFHFYVGPSKIADLGYLTNDNLFHVQLSDLADKPRELAVDADRILPGDGDLPLDEVIDQLRRINYSGYVSVEVMNPQIWRIPPLQFGEVGITALRKLLGQAVMPPTP